MYVRVSVGKKCSFSGKFGVLCFLETPALRFALLPCYRRVHVKLDWVCPFSYQGLVMTAAVGFTKGGIGGICDPRRSEMK